jgi:hypothetical protein
MIGFLQMLIELIEHHHFMIEIQKGGRCEEIIFDPANEKGFIEKKGQKKNKDREQ